MEKPASKYEMTTIETQTDVQQFYMEIVNAKKEALIGGELKFWRSFFILILRDLAKGCGDSFDSAVDFISSVTLESNFFYICAVLSLDPMVVRERLLKVADLRIQNGMEKLSKKSFRAGYIRSHQGKKKNNKKEINHEKRN